MLVAEDNSADVELVQLALEHQSIQVELTVHKDGEKMLWHIERIDAGEAPCPDIVLLDLNLPKVTGHSLLQRLRESRACGNVPIIIVSSSSALQDREAATRLGATAYFCKPNTFDEFMRLGQIVKTLVNTGRMAS